ncbi:Sec23/Sec24 family protein [Rhizophagus clarus]|uniref:Sec23/Sec24 family protein n=1 Tax=Rhizophagus clarus TaxID=94130 RepID=A0A8H3LKB8_9GLOM|nr:Sec23/Sec24 family protein [Rhizophagus clarus]
MYAQPPPPNAQQSQQRPSSNSPQPQQPPLAPRLATSAQQNFSGWRHGLNARPPPHMVPGVPPNARPPFVPGQRPPPNAGVPGIRPPAPGSSPIIPSSQPMNNTYSPSVTGTRPQVTSGYNQTIPPPLPGIPQYSQQEPDVVNTLVPQMTGLGINKSDQNTKPANKQNRPKRAHHLGSDLNSSSPNQYPQPPINEIQPVQQQMQQMYSPMVSQPPQPGQHNMQPVLNQPQYMQAPPIPGPQPPQPAQPPQPPTMARPTGPNAPRSRIDPNQIPSPVTVQEQDQELFDERPYMTCSKSNIPLASTDFKAIDEGNSNPRFMRLTLYSIPNTDDLLQTSHLPLGVILQPMAKLRNDEAPIELVDFQENGPVRCRRCKAYINPFVIFVEGGQKFICNMCLFSNEVPPEYFCHLDMNGRRADIDQRPELKYGTVEFAAPEEYWARPPTPLSHVFAIDVSWNAIKSGMLAKCVETIRDILFNNPNSIPPGGKIGIITFDKDVHFYNLQPQLEQAQMLVVSDINDVFVPLNSGFLVDPIESKAVIEGLLESLPTMFAENKAIESVLGAVVEAAHMALNTTGGKLIIFQTSLPTFGPGAIKHHSGICIDLFLFPNTYIDIATIGLLSCLTGGEMYYYPNFDVQKDGGKFAFELHQNITREFGYNSLMRIRCSNGLRVEEHFGNFNMRNTTDIELAGIDSDKAFGALLKYDGKLDEKTDAYIQCALLYTTATGQRRVRTHNLSVSVTTLLGNVFRHAEMDTTVNLLAKQAVSNTITKPLRDIRDQITDKCVKILLSYRRHCASSSSPGQLILPEAFKLFPLYALTMLKSKALRGGANLTSDARVYCMRLIKNIGVTESIVFLYPRLIPVHNLSDQFQVGYPNQYSKVKLPPLIRVSSARLESEGAYLLENGHILIFWIGRQVSSEFINNVFGVDTIEKIDSKLSSLPELENPTSIRIRSIISYLQTQRSKYLRLTIARMQIDATEIEFHNLLVEDENNGAMSYVDYLCYIHKQIQTEVNNMSD